MFGFEDYTLDSERRGLRRATSLLPIEPQAFDLLAYLITHRERVVSKDELIEAIWGGRIVSDSALTTRINAVRKAIGDSGEQQRLIRTVSRKGVRFVGSAQYEAVWPVIANRRVLSPAPNACRSRCFPSPILAPILNRINLPRVSQRRSRLRWAAFRRYL